MRQYFLFTVLMAVCASIALFGCSTVGPSDAVMEQLMKSDRSWCMSVSSVYATVRMGGSGLNEGTMTCTQEGLSLKAVAPASK